MDQVATGIVVGNIFITSTGIPTWQLYIAVLIVLAIVSIVILLLRTSDHATSHESVIAGDGGIAPALLRGYALALIDAHRYAEAEDALVSYLARFPADASMHALLGAVAVESGRHAVAVAELEHASQIMRRQANSGKSGDTGNLPLVLTALARELAATGRTTEANSAMAEAGVLNAEPSAAGSPAEALIVAARSIERERLALERITDWEISAPPPRPFGIADPAGALQFYKQALRHDAQSARLLADLAQAQHAVGDHQTAEKNFAASLRIAPQDYWAHFDFGCMLWRLGRIQDADRELAAAAQLAPRNTAILGTYALLLLKQGRGTEAEQALLTCLRHNSTVWVIARLYGNLLLMQNRLPEAVRAFREAERLGASDPAFRFDYAQALAQTNQTEDADEQFRLAVRAEAGTGRARARYGAFLLDRARFDEAEEQLKQAILWPESQAAHQYLAQLYLKERRLDEVPPHLQLALQANPNSIAARESHAELLLLRGQAAEALAALQQLVDEGVSRGTLHLLRGGALRALNRQLESETALREAQRADPGLARALLTHGRALRALGYYHAALECVGQCLALAPDQPEALAEDQAIRSEQAAHPASRRPDRRP